MRTNEEQTFDGRNCCGGGGDWSNAASELGRGAGASGSAGEFAVGGDCVDYGLCNFAAVADGVDFCWTFGGGGTGARLAERGGQAATAGGDFFCG